MEFEDQVYLASKYGEKGLSYEDLVYGDDLYYLDGSPCKESIIDNIWELVIEYNEGGSRAFYDKYSKYRLY